MDRAACEAFLAQQSVGRIAFSIHDRVDIEPLLYVFVRGWIYGRTQPGRKVDVLSHHRWVAFEVDEVEGPFEWRSVVVHGAWYSMAAAAPGELAEWEAGLAALRALTPTAFTKEDPVPFRTVVFRIHVAEVSGREYQLSASNPSLSANRT